MDTASYYERFVGPDGRAVVDATTHIERNASGMFRLVSGQGVALVNGSDEIESALKRIREFAPNVDVVRNLHPDENSGDGTDPDSLSPGELDAMLHDGESIRGAWPAF